MLGGAKQCVKGISIIVFVVGDQHNLFFIKTHQLDIFIFFLTENLVEPEEEILAGNP